MSGNLIPFGKYRGQPIEILENDPEYADWIAQQQWAKERYPQIVNIIINKFGESEETPDHNAMQAKYLDKIYAAKLVELIGGFKTDVFWARNANELMDGYRVKLDARLKKTPVDASGLVKSVGFEIEAVDVLITVGDVGVASISAKSEFSSMWETVGWSDCKRSKVAVELKPVISDDYPAILRQMRNNKSSVLVFGKYMGTGVDEATMRKFFQSQGLLAVKESEVDAVTVETLEARVKFANETVDRLRAEFDARYPNAPSY